MRTKRLLAVFALCAACLVFGCAQANRLSSKVTGAITEMSLMSQIQQTVSASGNAPYVADISYGQEEGSGGEPFIGIDLSSTTAQLGGTIQAKAIAKRIADAVFARVQGFSELDIADAKGDEIGSYTRPGSPPPSPSSGVGADAVPKGPWLKSVASLPVNASGEGTIQGAPTGDATATDTWGSFVLVLDPAPAGLPARTTVDVEFDHSTKVYRNGHALGDPLTAMNGASGPGAADPSAAGTVIVRFHIKDGRPFADRLDLRTASPPGMEP